MGNSKNPFEVIGLAPAALAGRSDAQIEKLVRVLAQGVLQIEHPDKGGKATRFREVNEAVEALKDADAFQKYKNLYVNPRRNRLLKLEEEVRIREIALGKKEKQFSRYIGTLGMQSGNSVFAPSGTRVSLLDCVAQQQLPQERKFSTKTPIPVFTLFFEEDGVREERNGQRKKTKRIPLGIVTLDHTMSITELVAECLEDRTVPKKRITGPKYLKFRNSPSPIRHFIPWTMGQPIIQRLEPHLVHRGYLFTFTTEDGIPGLYLEGAILATHAND